MHPGQGSIDWAPTTSSLHTKSKSFNDDIDVSDNYPIVYKESDCDYVNPLGATG